MTSKLALFALFYWFFLFLTCFLGGKLGFYHIYTKLQFHTHHLMIIYKSQHLVFIIPYHDWRKPEFASKKIEHQNKSDYKCLLFIE